MNTKIAGEKRIAEQYDFRSAEVEMQRFWQAQNVYQITGTRPSYTIDTPPPTVSGSLHVGHVFSYTHTDIIARYKRMSGHDVFYPFGFDDNGLPTERYVEQKHNVKSHEMKRSEFINLCIKESKEAGEKFGTIFLSLGLSAQLNQSYSTISDSTREISQRSFIELYKKGFIYRHADPALYCTVCQTTVAQAELDDADRDSVFYTIKFMTESGTELHIATTRPELLSSCVAVACHPEDQRYRSLIGSTVIVPLYNRTVKIYADERVEQEKGTGLVMISTFGDKTDIIWYRTLSLPYRPSLGRDGKFLPETGPLVGLSISQARTKIVALLREVGHILEEKKISHAVSLHERCKHEIEFLILPQWFVRILPHKEEFLRIADTINWFPTFMKSRYIDWVKNLSWDWCISRQRTYGIPFPAMHCSSCATVIFPDKNVALPIDPQEKPFATHCPQCKGTKLVPDTDVMDTWNTSSLTPYLCASLDQNQKDKPFSFDSKETKSFLPMGMRPQAHDIIRTWAFDTIVKTTFHHQTRPWNDIVISGHVLSKEKRKLSKKEGASLVPEVLLKEYPADAIRYWTSAARLGHDVVYSPDELKNGMRLITKLWNAFRFITPFLKEKEFDANSFSPRDIANRWIVHHAAKTFAAYDQYFASYEFSLALQEAERFFFFMCDNYLEFIKHQLYNQAEYKSDLVQETKQTLVYLGKAILQFFAPFLPHVTELLYQQLFRLENQPISLHQTQFAADFFEKFLIESNDCVVMGLIVAIVREVRRLKTEKKLSFKVPIQTLEIGIASPSKMQEKIAAQRQFIGTITNSTVVNVTSNPTTESVITEQNGIWNAQIALGDYMNKEMCK